MRKSKYRRGRSQWHRSRAPQIAQKTANTMLRLPEQSLRTKLAPPGAKHLLSPNPHSHKRSDKTKPAISRLSASPTPGNAPLLLKRPAWRPRNLHHTRLSPIGQSLQCSFTKPAVRAPCGNLVEAMTGSRDLDETARPVGALVAGDARCSWRGDFVDGRARLAIGTFSI